VSRRDLCDADQSLWRQFLCLRDDESLIYLISLDFAGFDRLYYDVFTSAELAEERAVKVGRPPLLTLQDQVTY
jgi:hypothetical protein